MLECVRSPAGGLAEEQGPPRLKILYLDESGDHNLIRIDPSYSVFVLGGIIVDRTYARAELRPRLRKLKQDFFGDPNINLHTVDIVRARNGFEALGDPDYRNDFYAALNALMQELDYKVVACAIKKPELVTQYGDRAEDPYMYALHVVIERFCWELGECVDGGIIYAEKRGEDLDRALEEAWERLKANAVGTGYALSTTIDQRIIDLVLKDKRHNVDGLQLADLVVSPIGRALMKYPPKPDWEIVKSKLRRGPGGQVRGYGLVVLP